jgi:hypothetical protein
MQMDSGRVDDPFPRGTGNPIQPDADPVHCRILEYARQIVGRGAAKGERHLLFRVIRSPADQSEAERAERIATAAHSTVECGDPLRFGARRPAAWWKLVFWYHRKRHRQDCSATRVSALVSSIVQRLAADVRRHRVRDEALLMRFVMQLGELPARGRNVTRVTAVLPAAFLPMTPSASSAYRSTRKPPAAAIDRNQSMWQLAIEATKASSGSTAAS